MQGKNQVLLTGTKSYLETFAGVDRRSGPQLNYSNRCPLRAWFAFMKNDPQFKIQSMSLLQERSEKLQRNQWSVYNVSTHLGPDNDADVEPIETGKPLCDIPTKNDVVPSVRQRNIGNGNGRSSVSGNIDAFFAENAGAQQPPVQQQPVRRTPQFIPQPRIDANQPNQQIDVAQFNRLMQHLNGSVHAVDAERAETTTSTYTPMVNKNNANRNNESQLTTTTSSTSTPMINKNDGLQLKKRKISFEEL